MMQIKEVTSIHYLFSEAWMMLHFTHHTESQNEVHVALRCFLQFLT